MSFHNLDKQAKHVAANYRRCEQELVSIISKIDRTKAFYKLGHSSLFSYMTKELKLSEAVACNLSAVIRKSYEVPELKQKVESGEISLSKARKLTPVITKENHKAWIASAKTKSQKQIEREVALAQPSAAVVEKMNYTAANALIKEKVQIKTSVPRLKMEVGLSEKLMLKLRRCQDLESQRQRKSINLECCLEALVDLYLEKKDPVKKAERQKMRAQLDAKAPVSDRTLHLKKVATPRGRMRRTPIPAKMKHAVVLRDLGRCTYIDSYGQRCSSRRHLEIHHVQPIHKGGSHDLENLRLLCHGHHKVEHFKP